MSKTVYANKSAGVNHFEKLYTTCVAAVVADQGTNDS